MARVWEALPKNHHAAIHLFNDLIDIASSIPRPYEWAFFDKAMDHFSAAVHSDNTLALATVTQQLRNPVWRVRKWAMILAAKLSKHGDDRVLHLTHEMLQDAKMTAMMLKALAQLGGRSESSNQPIFSAVNQIVSYLPICLRLENTRLKSESKSQTPFAFVEL